MGALFAVLSEEAEREKQEMLFRTYMGQAIWETNAILYKFGGAEYKRAQYIDLAMPENKAKVMTAEEIKQHVLDGLAR